MMKCLRMFLFLTLLTGVIYPLLITGMAWLMMHRKAEGSLIVHNGKTVGSALIGQKFESDKYFWGRPSASDYHAVPSFASNLGPISIELKNKVDERRKKYSQNNVPSELLFASGSGLDPHIHVETAYFQIDRVAKARGINPDALKSLIDQNTIPSEFFILGTPLVNVLQLNIALEKM